MVKNQIEKASFNSDISLDIPNVGVGTYRLVGSWIILMLLTEEEKIIRTEILTEVCEQLGITVQHFEHLKARPDVVHENEYSEWEQEWDKLG